MSFDALALPKWLTNLVVLIAAGVLVLGLGCNPGEGKKTSENSVPKKVESSPFQLDIKKEQGPVKRKIPLLSFREVQDAIGLKHEYINGERGLSLMVETTGGGSGWIDFDRDGRWDFYFNQGGDPAAPADHNQPKDQIFRAVAPMEYKNVTEQSWISEFGYSQGVAVGDYDNDGFSDIYVTNVGANTLWHNQGDGTFLEVTASAGVGDPRWSSSAAWADLDLDGDLDLYVCNYALYDPMHPTECLNSQGQNRICHPRNVEPAPDACYYNLGDGTFEDQSQQRGLFGPGNRALGVAVVDFNVDGFPDIYIANDTTANFLFMNDGKGYFTESAGVLGCAVDRGGSPQASMGLAIGDYDGNGLMDIYSTHFYEESNTLYANLGKEGFQDVTGLTGMHQLTLPFLAFGTVMSDFNRDGLPELIVANGDVDNAPTNPRHRMRPQLLTFDGRRWHDVGGAAGKYFSRSMVGRGVASGDIDDDGDLDIVICHQLDESSVLLNESERGNWLRLNVLCRSSKSNRDGIGTRAVLKAGDKIYVQELCGGTSYASSHQPVMMFGVGEYAGPCSLSIRWPSGKEQVLENVKMNQKLLVEESLD